MKEREMEALLWNHPEKFLHEPLTQFRRQSSSAVGRLDLVFKDRIGRLLVIELKKGILPREAIPQLIDYYGMLKNEFQETPVELMVVANSIPQERASACLIHNIEPREISEKIFRDVAEEVGFELESEKVEIPSLPPPRKIPIPRSLSASSYNGPARKVEKGWYYNSKALQAAVFLAFVNAKGSCSMRIFAADDGSFMGRRYARGDYQDAFREYISSSVSVTVSRQPNLERECKERLPSNVLAELRRQMHS